MKCRDVAKDGRSAKGEERVLHLPIENKNFDPTKCRL